MSINFASAPFCLASQQAHASNACCEGSPWNGTRRYRKQRISIYLRNNSPGDVSG